MEWDEGSKCKETIEKAERVRERERAETENSLSLFEVY